MVCWQSALNKKSVSLPIFIITPATCGPHADGGQGTELLAFHSHERMAPLKWQWDKPPDYLKMSHWMVSQVQSCHFLSTCGYRDTVSPTIWCWLTQGSPSSSLKALHYFWLFSKGPAQSPKTSLVSSLLVPSTVNFPFLSESTLSWASPLTTVGVLHTIQTTYEIWSALQKLLLSLNPTFCCSDYFWRLQVQKLQRTNDIAHGWKNAFCNFS